MVDRSKNYISKIELGLTNPPVSLIFDIFDKLGIQPSKLFTLADSVIDESNSDFNTEVSKIVDAVLRNKLKEILNVFLS